MIYNQFKDKKLSALGFGTMRLPLLSKNAGDIDQVTLDKMVDMAMLAGVNYFDTAYPYHEGKAENAIATSLARYPRDSYYLADKFPGHQLAKSRKRESPETIFEDQLKKCGVDYFDFYLMHNFNENSASYYLDERNNYIDYFLEQKKNGRIKHLGFSCHSAPDGLKEYLNKYGQYMEFCQIQLNYLDWTLQNAEQKVKILNEYGLPIWVMEPVRGGRLAKLDSETEEKMQTLRPGASTASWAFRWLQTIPQPTMILSGMSAIEQMEDNIKTFSCEAPLNETEISLVYAAVQKLEKLVPCTGCRYCCSGCPKGLDIPNLINLSNDLNVSYSVNVMARYETLGPGKHAEDCISCGQCVQSCPQNINVPEVLAAFSEKLSTLQSWEEICRSRENAQAALQNHS